MSDSRSILVIGSTGHAGVKAINWNELSQIQNLANFDIIIVCWATYPAEGLHYATVDRVDQVIRVLFGGSGDLWFIGSPQAKKTKSGSINPTQWLPSQPTYRHVNRANIHKSEEGFEFYFAHTQYCEYVWEHTLGAVEVANVNRVLGGRLSGIDRPEVTTLAYTKSREIAALKLTFTALATDSGLRTGYVYWLPAPTTISASDGVDLILQHRFNIVRSHSEPDWADSIRLPNETSIRSSIDQLENRIRNDNADLLEKQLALKTERRFVGLLYQGHQALNERVDEALTLLGATVEVRPDVSKDDGLLTEPNKNRLIVYEVKSTETKPLKEDHVRQAAQWRVNVAFDKKVSQSDVMAVVFANTKRELPPDERKEPFGSTCPISAARQGVALVTTEQLFKAIGHLQEGKFDQAAFWDQLCSTAGVFEFKPAAPPAEPAAT